MRVAAAVKAVLTVRGAGTGPGLVPGAAPAAVGRGPRAPPFVAFRFTHYRVVSFPREIELVPLLLPLAGLVLVAARLVSPYGSRPSGPASAIRLPEAERRVPRPAAPVNRQTCRYDHREITPFRRCEFVQSIPSSVRI